MAVTFSGMKCISPRLLRESFTRLGLPITSFDGKANSITFGINGLVDEGWFLLPAEDVETIIASGFNDHTIVFTDGTNTLTLQKIRILSSTQINAKTFGGKNIVLLKVGSAKSTLEQTVLQDSYNLVREVVYPTAFASNEYTHYAQSLSAGSLWTWQNALNDATGVTVGNASDLPGTPENILSEKHSALALLEVVAKESCLPFYIAANGSPTFVNTASPFEISDLDTDLGDPEYKIFSDDTVSFPGTKVYFQSTEYHCVSMCSVSMSCSDEDLNVARGTVTTEYLPVRYSHATRKLNANGEAVNQADLDAVASYVWGNVQRLVLSDDAFVYPGVPSTFALGHSIHQITFRDLGFGPQTVVKRIRDINVVVNSDTSVDNSLPMYRNLSEKTSAIFRTPVGGIPPETAALCTRRVFDYSTCEWADQSIQEPLLNPFDTNAKGDTLIYAAKLDGVWQLAGIVGTEAPWIRFITNEDISGRVVRARVDLFYGDAVDPLTGSPVEIGDVVYIHDIQNMWPEITKDCIGTAFFREAREANPEADPPVVARPARWEIETCSLIASEIEVELMSTLLATDATGTAKTSPAPKKRSTYPNVMPVDTVTEEPRWVTFKNPWGLDALCNSKAILRRIVPGVEFAEYDAEFPVADSKGTPTWEVVLVEKRKARHILITVPSEGGTVTINAYYEGEDPESCGDSVVVEFPLGQYCLAGKQALAFYDTNTDKYQVYSSASAMLGPPVVRNMPYTLDAGKSSGSSPFPDKLTWKEIDFFAFPHCEGTENDEEFGIPHEDITVGTCIYVSGNGLYLSRTSVTVLSVGVDDDPCVVEGTTCDDYYYYE